MVRRSILALAVLGVFFVVTAGSSQAGWGHHSESSQPGESMSSESMSPEPEETTRAYEDSREGSTESSEYKTEEPVETGRLPEGGWSESSEPVVNEIGGQLFRQGIDDGP
jgi:hypothetical protein